MGLEVESTVAIVYQGCFSLLESFRDTKQSPPCDSNSTSSYNYYTTINFLSQVIEIAYTCMYSMGHILGGVGDQLVVN